MKKLMKCPQCGQNTTVVSVIEVACNNRYIHGVELCPKCRDEFLKAIPLYQPKVEDVLPIGMSEEPIEQEATKIVTKEQLMEIMAGTLNPEDVNNDEILNKEPCPTCGQTLQMLQETNKMGCQHCYDHFEEMVADFSSLFQGGTQHVGKTPKSILDKQEKLKNLKLKLAHAKEHEKFAEAASLLNQIKEMK